MKLLCFLTFGFSSKCTFLRLRLFISPRSYLINSIFRVVVCIYKNHVFDEAFLFLAIFAIMTEKMYFSYFHGNSCRRKIHSSNHAAYQSKLYRLSDKVYWRKIVTKAYLCSLSLRLESLATDSKWISIFFTTIYYHLAQSIWFFA